MNRIPDFPSQDSVLIEAGINPGPAKVRTQQQPEKKQEPTPLKFLTQVEIINEAACSENFQGADHE